MVYIGIYGVSFDFDIALHWYQEWFIIIWFILVYTVPKIC